MVFPYMDHDLAGLLENKSVQLAQSHIKLYMKQLLEGLEYMHEVRCLVLSLNMPLMAVTEPHHSPRHQSCQYSHLK